MVSGQQRGAIDPAMAAALLRNARTPEEDNRIGAALLQSLQPPAPSADRFQIIHDANGNWVRLDRLTGQTTPYPGQQQKAEQTVEIETGGNKQRYQWNPKTQRYDIPVGVELRNVAADILECIVAEQLKLCPVCSQNGPVRTHEMERYTAVLEEVFQIARIGLRGRRENDGRGK